MGPKRPLGLGRSSLAKKKQKILSSGASPEVELELKAEAELEAKNETPISSEEVAIADNELTVELEEAVDPTDELSQLRALWFTFLKSERDNELVLNGIIHECDRLLRNTVGTKESSLKSSSNSDKLPAYFHSIYALSLAELAAFNSETDKVKDFFDAALERVQLGFESHPNSSELFLAKSKILLNRIPLEYISKMDLDSQVSGSKNPEVLNLLEDALDSYSKINKNENLKNSYFKECSEILDSLNDLLDIVENFGRNDEGLDSDDEEEEIEEQQQQLEQKLSKKHPLYKLAQKIKDYTLWWRKNTQDLLLQLDFYIKENNLDKIQNEIGENNELILLYREINKKLGQSYLIESEEPSSIYASLTYDNEDDLNEINGLTAENSSKIAQNLIKKAISYLLKAEDPESPQSWVDIAEAQISLGNLFELESDEQENIYKEAEKRLRKANRATHGKYDDILNNLCSNNDD
ncbi:hypothetical protein PACTADRAFT_49297 [Pachysolen tannophilus NRRL Y-2460]|uniref:Enhancer of translation termination 1 n=1 Tax=Pachysolen tannophilus NRRL Y-2460 TaxID=669874 RepID=A0A1E4TVU4_PACTA|nr:hypothetical protein PACTADRAFT_49297 [Pachysolen tannophilus NRRL Y-2460]